jgi:hypothetical protein
LLKITSERTRRRVMAMRMMVRVSLRLGDVLEG